jgi:uncharacterized protein YjbI with pentapeptide repeats
MPWWSGLLGLGSRSRRIVRVAAIAVAGAVVVALVGVCALWLVPEWLTRYPKVTGADKFRALADARTGTLTFLGFLGAAVSVVYAARTFRLSRTGQITDRYAKAIDQLGDESPDVCIGGIYSLGRIMSDSDVDQDTVVEVLSAFVRGFAKRTGDDTRAPWSAREAEADEIKPAPRVQAALNVLGYRDPLVRGSAPNLRDTDLRGARMRDGARFSGASFRRSYLYGAHLEDADFAGATFIDADLRKADCKKANLQKARLKRAILLGAELEGADIQGADLQGALVTCGALSDEQIKSALNADKIAWVRENPIGIHALVVEGYVRAAPEAEDNQAKERLRELREKELRNDAAKMAHALTAHGVEHTDDRISGWLIPLGAHDSTHPEHERWQLGDDGKIYRNGKPLGQLPGAQQQCVSLTDTEMNTALRYLADFAVRNNLDPDLFKHPHVTFTETGHRRPSRPIARRARR